MVQLLNGYLYFISGIRKFVSAKIREIAKYIFSNLIFFTLLRTPEFYEFEPDNWKNSYIPKKS